MTRVLSVTARLNKLRGMSVAEIRHRLRHAALIAHERRRHGRGRLALPDRLERSLLPHLRTADWKRRLIESRLSHRCRFFESVTQPEQMRTFFATAYATERQATALEVTKAKRKQFEFFGRTFAFDGEIDWQADPVSGVRWPALYHADVPVHSGDLGFGDVKYVWELNRQQFVVDLAKSWFLEGHRSDLVALEHLVDSWIASNPYATGVNWSCALEPAFRVFSWLWGYYLTVDALDEPFHLSWIQAFYDHGRFLERHLELYSSPYNHLIAEAAALHMLGLCFPEFREAARWRDRGRAILEDRLDQQFYADGGSVEQSTFYHHATLGFYLLAGVLARRLGADLSREVWSAIERAIEFSMMLSQPDGSTPTIGGADDGKPIRMEHLRLWDFRPYQAVGAVLFGRTDFKYVAGRFHEDALWLLGPSGRSAFDALAPQAPGVTSVSLPLSGYYVMRDRWSPDADYVCFDCGEQAAGMRTDSVSNSMHGHADCLSIIVWLNGRRVLVDSGLFAYNCGGDWEAHFRETAAHNTATVDGRDQARHIRKMAWSHSYRATLDGWAAEGEQAWVIGSHDGYSRGPHGVVHRRAVWLRPDSYLLVYDEFIGHGDHDLTVNFQFAPGSFELVEGTRAVFEGVDVAWASPHAWKPRVACGGSSPAEGWIAPSLGIREAAPRLTLQCVTSSAKTTLLTVFAAPARAPRILRPREADPIHEGLIIVRGEGYADYVAAAGITSSPLIDTDALLAVCRANADDSHRLHQAGGTRAEIDNGLLRELLRGEARDTVVSR